MQAQNFFARLKLPEPTWDADGAPVWDCSEETMARAYAEAMKCCHPGWSHHRSDTGFALLTEAHDVLTNHRQARRGLRAHVAEAASAPRASPPAPSAAADHSATGPRDGVEQLVDGGREEARRRR